MVFEMTRDAPPIEPVILTLAIACAVRNWLSPSTIYTLKLLRRGHVVPQGLQAWMGEMRSTDVLSRDFQLLTEAEAADGSASPLRAPQAGQVVVLECGTTEVPAAIDVVSHLDSLDRSPSPSFHVAVGPDDRFHEVLRAMDAVQARVAIVMRLVAATGKQEVLGVVTERQIARVACTSARLTC